MLSEIKAIGSEQVQGRREYPIAGGSVLYVPADTSPAWRAVNTMGVLLGSFDTYAKAESAVRENAPHAVERTPPPRTRCATCRGRHATEHCPARPGKKGDEHGKQGSGGAAPRGRSGGGQGPADAGTEWAGGRDHADHDRRRLDHRQADQVQPSDVGRAVPCRDAVNASDTHLDDYATALRSLTTAGNAVPIHAVACKVQGGATTKTKRSARAALDELVARGLAEMPFPGRYRALVVPAGVRVNGREVVWSDISVTVPEENQPRLDEPGFVGRCAAASEERPETEPAESQGISPEALALERAGDASMDRHVRCRCLPLPPGGELHSGEEPPPASPPEPPVTLDPIERLAGSFTSALLGVAEYPDAIIAEAEVFAKRAAKALEVARAERERAEAEERGAFEAWNRARNSREAARERVKRLERIAQGVE